MNLKAHIERLGNNRLAMNTLSMFMGQGLRLVIQAAYFILMAHRLGPAEYGRFVGVTALVAIVSPFVGIGSDKLLVKHVANDRSRMGLAFTSGLCVIVVTGVVATGLTLALSRWILPASATAFMVAMICFADLIAFRIVDLTASAFQAAEHMAMTARLNVSLSAFRLFGMLGLAVASRNATALSWSEVYAGTTVIAMVTALVSVRRIVVSPAVSVHWIRSQLPEGFAFAIGQSAQTVYNDLDKTMLARLATVEATGIYAAAYRLIDVSFTPVRALLFAAYPSFFRFQGDLAGSVAFAKGLLRRPVVISSILFVAILLFAPVVPLVLGVEYSRAVETLRWLSLLPLLKSVHYFLADALTGAGYQARRMGVQIAVALFNIGINLWLIPRWSWRGAAWASIASDTLLVVLLWLTILASQRSRSNQTDRIGSEAVMRA